MEKLIWSWEDVFTGSVPKHEHPIITLAKAGFVFRDGPGTEAIYLNNIHPALSTDGSQNRKIQISIQVIDEVKPTNEEIH